MDDLGFDISQSVAWFASVQDDPYVLVRITDENLKALSSKLIAAIRRCYITDELLEMRAADLKTTKQKILQSVLPDAGSTMAGDFGELLTYFFQASRENSKLLIGAKKWRLKQDRTKPAPFSDVVHLSMATWPKASDRDVVLCSEVKTKATSGSKTTPIESAIDDCAKDRTSRLARTLVWLRERAHTSDLGELKIEHLNRFIDAVKGPKYSKKFHAVAVVCSDLVDTELVAAPSKATKGYKVVVISVPSLQNTYTAIFDSIHKSVIATPAATAPRVLIKLKLKKTL